MEAISSSVSASSRWQPGSRRAHRSRSESNGILKYFAGIVGTGVPYGDDWGYSVSEEELAALRPIIGEERYQFFLDADSYKTIDTNRFFMCVPLII